MAGNLRHWHRERLQTLIFFIDTKVNLDFFGIGESAALGGQHLSYTLHLTGGAAPGPPSPGRLARMDRTSTTPSW